MLYRECIRNLCLLSLREQYRAQNLRTSSFVQSSCRTRTLHVEQRTNGAASRRTHGRLVDSCVHGRRFGFGSATNGAKLASLLGARSYERGETGIVIRFPSGVNGVGGRAGDESHGEDVEGHLAVEVCGLTLSSAEPV